MASGPPDELYPLALLIDELKHDDVTLRLNAMRRLSTIAMALGQDRSRNELVPFLEEVTQEDEDEVLTVLAEELGNFIPYIGGPEYSQILISPLETLSSVEEPVVRDKAVESLNHICMAMTREQAISYFIPLIKRLSSTEWFSSRVSATGLYSSAISKLTGSEQSELLSLYKNLSQDEAPMVRRAAAKNLPKLISVIPDLQTDDNIFLMFESQVKDDQDSVRLLSVDVLIAIAQALKKNQETKYTSDLISFTNTLFTDKSWRVRYMAADRFEQLAESLDSTEARDKFVPAFVKLMKDSEAEVRTAIAKQIPGFCSLIPREVIRDEVLATVDQLAQDSNQHVRAALASEINRLAPLLGKDYTIEYLLPTFLEMLKDEFPDVRLSIISKLQVVNQVIGIELLSKSLLPAISELAKDKQWRVRLAIIEYIPLLAQQLGVSFFDRELGPLCMTWLWDSVYSIREAATLNLKKLAEAFGVEWAKEEIIPHIIIVGTNSNYLYRLTVLFAVTVLIPVVSTEVITESILPFINNLMDDPIPNIRFNIAKSLKVLVEAFLNPQYPLEEAGDKLEGQHNDKVNSQNASEDVKDDINTDTDLPTTAPEAEEAIAPTNTDSKVETKSTDDVLASAPLHNHLPLGPRADPATIKNLIDTIIVPNLEKLADDPDVDVRYFANKSLEEIDIMVQNAGGSIPAAKD